LSSGKTVFRVQSSIFNPCSVAMVAVAAYGSAIFYLTPAFCACVILSVPHRSPCRQQQFSLSPAITMAGFNRSRRGDG